MKKIFRLKRSFIKIIICFIFFWNPESFSFEKLESNNKQFDQVNLNPKLVSPRKDFYLLGAGDTLSIEFQGLENLFPTSFKIDHDGNIFLPRLKKVYVEGLTVSELTALLTSEYEKYIINPDLIINVLEYRNVGVYVLGEVVEPGYYIFDNKLESMNEVIQQSLSPSLFDAIRRAGGITPYSSIDNIRVVRNLSRLESGEKIQTEINLMSTLMNGQESQNIKLYDQDQIIISKSSNLLKDQYLNAIKSNFNPKLITVFISGRIRNSQSFELPRGTSLNQAISIAGGIKPISGRIEFIRLNNKGIDKRVFNFNSNSETGSYKNPFLQTGDVIRIQNSILSNIAEAVGEVTKPALGILAIEQIFD